MSKLLKYRIINTNDSFIIEPLYYSDWYIKNSDKNIGNIIILYYSDQGLFSKNQFNTCNKLYVYLFGNIDIRLRNTYGGISEIYLGSPHSSTCSFYSKKNIDEKSFKNNVEFFNRLLKFISNECV